MALLNNKWVKEDIRGIRKYTVMNKTNAPHAKTYRIQ